MTQDPRIHRLNDKELRSSGRFVLYWMHRAQRAVRNPALQHAVKLARQCDASVLAVIVLPRNLPDRYARHYAFMLEGLESAREKLAEKKIKLVAQRGDPVDLVSDLAKKARAVVTDGGYLRRERAWRKSVAKAIDCPLDWVETETVVPVEIASDKREYAARTIRKKINRRRDEFIVAQRDRWPDKSSLPLEVKGDIDLSDAGRALDALGAALVGDGCGRDRLRSKLRRRGVGLPGRSSRPGSAYRSEERCVGKECRSRWSPYH